MYTIQFLQEELSTFEQVGFQRTLREIITLGGRFKVERQHWGTSTLTRKERKEAATLSPDRTDLVADHKGILLLNFAQVATLYLQKIRLTTPKPYCGNHPGACYLNGRKKPTTSYLEWDDWVAFHTLVNGVCDYLQVSANIWTLPQDARGKMWIRKGTLPRLKWDYQEKWEPPGSLQPLRVWNTGSADQFT